MFPKMNLMGSIVGAIRDPNIDLIPGIGPNANDVTSKDYANRNANKESYRMNGKIYNFAGQVIGTYGGATSGNETQPTGDQQNTDANVGTYNGSEAVAAQKVGDAATIGQYDNIIGDLERQLGLLPGQLEAGLNQITDGYNKGLSRLNEQQSNALTRFKTQRDDTRSDFDGSLGDIDTQARGNYQAIQALLGRAGSGSSSAAEVLTPYAVSTEASKTRSKVADTYGRNLRDLDLAEDETKQSYQNNRNDLDDQRRTSEYGLRQGIEGQKSKILSSKAEAEGNRELARGSNWQTAKNAMSGTINARNDVDAAVSTLLNQFRNPYNVKDVAVKEAKLSNYAVDANGVKVEGGKSNDSDTAAQTQAQIKAEEERKKKEGVTA